MEKIVYIISYIQARKKKRHFYEFGGLKCPSFDELVLDSYEWWTSCIKAMRELIAGLKRV